MLLVNKMLPLLLLCSDSRNDVPPVPQRNVSIAAERGAVRPSTQDVTVMFPVYLYYYTVMCLNIGTP